MSDDELFIKAYENDDPLTAGRLLRSSFLYKCPNGLRNKKGLPKVLYHSYEDEGFPNYDSGMVFLSASRSFSKEFGDFTDRVYAMFDNPYLAEDDVLRKKDGTPYMNYGEEMRIGYLDEMPGIVNDYIRLGYDGIIGSDAEFVVAFSENCIKSADIFTFDNSGKLIPLFKRFDKTKTDIRY